MNVETTPTEGGADGCTRPKQARLECSGAEEGLPTRDPLSLRALLGDPSRALQPLADEQLTLIIGASLDLLASAALDEEFAQTLLRLLLRVTRRTKIALGFHLSGGTQALLALRRPASFPGFYQLFALVLRHLMELEDTSDTLRMQWSLYLKS